MSTLAGIGLWLLAILVGIVVAVILAAICCAVFELGIDRSERKPR